MLEQSSRVDMLSVDRLTGEKYFVGETSCLEGYSGLNREPA